MMMSRYGVTIDVLVLVTGGSNEKSSYSRNLRTVFRFTSVRKFCFRFQVFLLYATQRQRIAIARAILRDAPLVLLDEITSALDSEVSRSILEELPDTFAGKTVLFVTHDAQAAAYMDRMCRLG